MKEDRSPEGGAVSVGWGRRQKPGSWWPQWAFKEEQVSLTEQVTELCLCVWRNLLLHLPWNLHWNPLYLLRVKCFVSEDWQLQDAGYKAGMYPRAKVTHCSLANPTLLPHMFTEQLTLKEHSCLPCFLSFSRQVSQRHIIIPIQEGQGTCHRHAGDQSQMPGLRRQYKISSLTVLWFSGRL